MRPMRLVMAPIAAIALIGSMCAWRPLFNRNGLPPCSAVLSGTRTESWKIMQSSLTRSAVRGMSIRSFIDISVSGTASGWRQTVGWQPGTLKNAPKRNWRLAFVMGTPSCELPINHALSVPRNRLASLAPGLRFALRNRQIGPVGGEDVDLEIEQAGDRRRVVASPATDAEPGLAYGGNHGFTQHVLAQTDYRHTSGLGGGDDPVEAEIDLELRQHQPDTIHRPAVRRGLDHGVELEAGD